MTKSTTKGETKGDKKGRTPRTGSLMDFRTTTKKKTSAKKKPVTRGART